MKGKGARRAYVFVESDVAMPNVNIDSLRTIASGSSRVPRELKHITIGSKRNQLGGPE